MRAAWGGVGEAWLSAGSRRATRGPFWNTTPASLGQPAKKDSAAPKPSVRRPWRARPYSLRPPQVLQMRGTVSEANPWDVKVDLFFYR